jgi:hypothetical protein
VNRVWPDRAGVGRQARARRPAERDGPGRVVATGSRLLFDALAGVYAGLGFSVVEKDSRKIENDVTKKAEPVWDPEQHPGSWRAVWAAKRAARDNKTLSIQENRAREIIAGENKVKTTRFVKNANGKRTLDQPGLTVPASWPG